MKLEHAARRYEQIYYNLKYVRGATRLAVWLKKKAAKEMTEKGNDGIYSFTNRYGEIKVQDPFDIEPFISEEEYIHDYLEHLEQGCVVADAGSFHGLYSLYAGKKGEAYCFELSKCNADKIKENLELNPGANVTVVERPVWNVEKRVSVPIEGGGQQKVGKSGENKMTVTLDNYFRDREPPDIIKIDVEGDELKVLQGAEELIENHGPRLYIELHFPEEIYTYHHPQVRPFFQYLAEKDYRIESITSRGGEHLVIASSKKEK